MKTNNNTVGSDCLARLVRDFDVERAEEYNQLLQLIMLAGSLNRGSDIVDKIKTMESIAKQLSSPDIKNPRQSFVQWLCEAVFYFHAENEKRRQNNE